MKGLAPLIGIIFLIALAIKYWWIVLIVAIVVGAAYLIIKTAAPLRTHAADRDMETRSVCRYAVRGPTADTRPWSGTPAGSR